MKKQFLVMWVILFGFIPAMAQNIPGCNAQFTFSVTGNVVNFVSLPSSSATAHSWSFGDGNTSTIANPSNTYFFCGTYLVHHVVVSGNCVDSSVMTVVVNQNCSNNCSLVANFTATNTTSPNTFTFTNTSTGFAPGDSIRWTFGDGSMSTNANPTHTYANPGTYTVCLRVKKGNWPATAPPCVRDVCQAITVTNPVTCNIQAAFSIQPTTTTPNSYQFTNTSVNLQPGDSVLWNFGDGTTSVQPNPVHTYANPGTYIACIRVKRMMPAGTTPCVREACQTVVVNQPNPCTIVPSYTYTSNANNVFVFTNTTAGSSANALVQWNFGDNTTGTGQIVTHTYTQPGTYQVCLRITLSNTCIRDTCMTVVVNPITPTPCTLQASYTYTNSGYTYSFVNTTTGYAPGDSIRWTFSNGNVTNVQNPVINFQTPGRYRVCLRVKKPTLPGAAPCISERCDSITVAPVPCAIPMTISVQPAPNAGNVMVFTYQSPTTNAPLVNWNFGNGTTGTGPVVTHTYPQAGVYTVCVRVTVSNTCFRDSCFTVTVGGSTPPSPSICDSIQTRFTYTQDVYMPNKLYFITVSNYPVASESWTITPLTLSGPAITINQYNPAYVFPQVGSYRVCLRAVIQNGCIKEYCDTVSITSLGTQCLLSAYPNPATTQVSVTAVLSMPTTIYANLYNSQNILVRQRVQAGVSGNNIVGFNIATLPAGMYTIRLYYGQQVCTARFMKY